MANKASATEVAVTTPLLTSNTKALAEIGSFADAMQLLTDSGIDVRSTAEFGDGFALTEKVALVGEPFIILGIKFVKGKYDDEFVVLHLVTEDGRKCIVTDGSTGIRDQARYFVSEGIEVGLLVPKGLEQSDYTYTDSDGNSSPATTFYLS